MTLSTTTARNSYVGDGSTALFPYTFKVYDQDDLKVYVGGTLKTITTDYTVTGVGNDAGGNVDFTPSGAPATAAEVVIFRDQPLKQTIDLILNGTISSSALEQALDEIVMEVQTLKDMIDRAPLVAAHALSTDLPITMNSLVAGKTLTAGTDEKSIIMGTADTSSRTIVTNAGDQTLGLGGPTKIVLDTVTLDTLSEFDATTNYRFTPGVAGGYLINVFMRANYIADNGLLWAEIRKNTGASGSDYLAAQMGRANITQDAKISMSALNILTPPDYIEIYVFNNTGGNLTLPAGWLQFSSVRLW